MYKSCTLLTAGNLNLSEFTNWKLVYNLYTTVNQHCKNTLWQRDSLCLLAGTSLAMGKCTLLAGMCKSKETALRIKAGSAEKIFPLKMV